MYDKIEKFGKGSLFQHGSLNNRIYLMKLDKKDTDYILPFLSELAQRKGYNKIFCKIPSETASLFLARGYVLESIIPGFYKGIEDAFMVSKFLSPASLTKEETDSFKLFKNVIEEEKQKNTKKTVIKSDFKLRRLKINDAETLSNIFRTVFKSYPFPVFDPEYIRKTMEKEDVYYYGAEKDGKIAGVSSCEIDPASLNAEMTDFSTLKEFKGNNLSLFLLKNMEKDLKEKGFKTLYTIARLNSVPMNKTFLRCNYSYSGTLIKNTNIAGSIESMNVYYKHI